MSLKIFMWLLYVAMVLAYLGVQRMGYDIQTWIKASWVCAAALVLTQMGTLEYGHIEESSTVSKVGILGAGFLIIHWTLWLVTQPLTPWFILDPTLPFVVFLEAVSVLLCIGWAIATPVSLILGD